MGGGGGLLGGVSDFLFGDGGAGAAASAQAAAAEKANATQKYIYDQNREDTKPWREAGMEALKGMQGSDYQRDFTMADYQQDPGYNFRLQEGMKAINNAAGARGMMNSGATMKALTKYGQNVATEEYNNAYNRFNADRDRRFGRLSSLAGLGSGAMNTQVQAANNYGNAVSSNQIGLGNAQAANAIQAGNRGMNLFNSVLSAGATFGGAYYGAKKG